MFVLCYFALEIGATEVMPFYGDLFASYNLFDNSPLILSEITSLYSYWRPIFLIVQYAGKQMFYFT